MPYWCLRTQPQWDASFKTCAPDGQIQCTKLTNRCTCVCCVLCLQSWLKDASNTFKGLDGPISTGYAVLTASLLAAGLGYIFAPSLTLQGVSATCLPLIGADG